MPEEQNDMKEFVVNFYKTEHATTVVKASNAQAARAIAIADWKAGKVEDFEFFDIDAQVQGFEQ